MVVVRFERPLGNVVGKWEITGGTFPLVNDRYPFARERNGQKGEKEKKKKKEKIEPKSNRLLL